MGRLLRLPSAPPPLAAAVDAFLEARDLAQGTLRVYRLTLEALVQFLGPDRRVDELTGGQLQVFLASRWAAAAPATWNRQVATLRSLMAWCARQGWVDHDPTSALERRSQPTRSHQNPSPTENWSGRGNAPISLCGKTLGG